MNLGESWIQGERTWGLGAVRVSEQITLSGKTKKTERVACLGVGEGRRRNAEFSLGCVEF
jgi:hypothetical protein